MLAKHGVVKYTGAPFHSYEEQMKAQIFRKHDERGRLLARTARQSLARALLGRAQPEGNQSQLITCDEQAAAALLESHSSTMAALQVIKSQMKALGPLKSAVTNDNVSEFQNALSVVLHRGPIPIASMGWL